MKFRPDRYIPDRLREERLSGSIYSPDIKQPASEPVTPQPEMKETPPTPDVPAEPPITNSKPEEKGTSNYRYDRLYEERLS